MANPAVLARQAAALSAKLEKLTVALNALASGDAPAKPARKAKAEAAPARKAKVDAKPARRTKVDADFSM